MRASFPCAVVVLLGALAQASIAAPPAPATPSAPTTPQPAAKPIDSSMVAHIYTLEFLFFAPAHEGVNRDRSVQLRQLLGRTREKYFQGTAEEEIAARQEFAGEMNKHFVRSAWLSAVDERYLKSAERVAKMSSEQQAEIREARAIHLTARREMLMGKPASEGLERALKLLAPLGKDDISTLEVTFDLGWAQMHEQNLPVACRTMGEAYKMAKRIFDERHPYVALAAFEAGAMQLQRGQYEHAKILLEQADAILVEHRLITTPAYAVGRMTLAELAFKDREFAKANELASEGIAVAMLSQPMPVGRMHQAYATLAKCLVEEGRPQAAMQILVKSTRDSSFSHVTPQIQADVITTLATIGEMLGDTGEAAVARDYIARLQKPAAVNPAPELKQLK